MTEYVDLPSKAELKAELAAAANLVIDLAAEMVAKNLIRRALLSPEFLWEIGAGLLSLDPEC